MIICNRCCWCLWIAWNCLLLSDNVRKPCGVCVAFSKAICHHVFSKPVLYKVTECTGLMSRLCKRKKAFDWKIWQAVLAFWAQETTNFSLWQISVILRTVTKDIFTLHFYCQSMVLSLLRLHPVTGEKICVLSLSNLCKKYILQVQKLHWVGWYWQIQIEFWASFL